jgi:uncharacterized protein DUF2255
MDRSRTRRVAVEGASESAAWSEDELRKIIEADDLRISPFREDGVTPGTPTWIWTVAVDGGLYVRGYTEQDRAGIRPRAARRLARSRRPARRETFSSSRSMVRSTTASTMLTGQSMAVVLISPR